ncbi:hypothetical protein [Actinomadura rubrisoli]|uniref:hypothetical protein n=1 Tax=Actinomadura rubrisoli TaxID=2530368 RepID=UPI001404DC8C|nr:hypothetical protein [Actinomadura rubrisoli]
MGNQPKRRICRTPDEAFRAGQEDGRHDRPLSPAEITRIATLLRPHLREPRSETDE